jgi:prepilin-type N-terminal cleavage/methylation domain-containing protein
MSKRGFTLIEILIVIGIIALLAAGIIIALNPGRQFAKARDTQRVSHLNDILKAILQNVVDNKGKFNCAAGDLPTTTPKNMSSNAGDYDIAPCLVPTYMPRMPVDPKDGSWTDVTNYDTKYQILQDATTGRIILRATGELTPTIEVSQ